MLDVPSDLGKRILDAARVAVLLHLEAADSDRSHGIRTGGAGHFCVRDDAPSAGAIAPVDSAEREVA